MFVRRFLIHTSQGNNTQRLSLVEFLKSRLTWESPDVALLQATVEEELADLQRVDEEITVRSEQQQRQQQEREQAQRQGGAGAGASGAARQGRLYATGIPTRTSYIAIFQIAAAVACLLYSASVFTTAEKLLVSNFIRSALTYAVVAGVALLLAGGSTGYHAFRVTAPLKRAPLVVRLFFTTVAAILVAYGLYLVSKTMLGYVEVDGTKLAAFFTSEVKSNPTDVCDYFTKFGCSGFSYTCTTADAYQCPTCPSYPSSATCEQSLQTKIKSSLTAVFIILVAGAVGLFGDYLMLVRLWQWCKVHPLGG
jgi:hypothetical protein